MSPPTSSDSRPFITCHVLDTISGKPGPGIAVTLKLISPTSNTSASSWTAQTNSDGRVTSWEKSDATNVDLNSAVAEAKKSISSSSTDNDYLLFSLTFATEAYFGKGKTFWPEVELRFAAQVSEEHYHVPLLLGPWSYTTYRGS